MGIPRRIERGARKRIRAAEDEIRSSLRLAAEGNPLGAEYEESRLVARLKATAQLSKDEARHAAARIIAAARESRSGEKSVLAPMGAQTVFGSRDFVSVAFLELGVRAARAVARVRPNGETPASGVMISDRLFLTNNHTIQTAKKASVAEIEFAYELDTSNRPVQPTRFALAPSDFFLADEANDLDYTLVAVGPKVSGTGELRDFGWCPLSDDPTKHALGEVANIVQHPGGGYKEVVIRENRLVSRPSRVLHYVADTEVGSSGSPVFNNEWRMIALHHWGEPVLQREDENGRRVPMEVNEGIRVSAIVGELRERLDELPAPQRDLLREALSLGEKP
jgi:endonuclease G